MDNIETGASLCRCLQTFEFLGDDLGVDACRRAGASGRVGSSASPERLSAL
ncbi:MAG: hypothetical protein LC721_04210 [Actinobacteria bacterium]|nr:hypothetical protein [Actinomycetota bacterium]